MSFAPSLDSAWLVYEHRDVPPGDYKATSMWGVDGGTGQFVAFTFDNFHGHRQWSSSGWSGGKLVLSTVFEHFIYERLSATQFKMTYEVSRDDNRAKRRLRTRRTKGRGSDEVPWRLGDWLVFTRVPE